MAPEVQAFFEAVSIYQALIWAAVVVGAFIAIYKAWPFITRAVVTINALASLPTFMAGTTATLAAQDVKIDVVHHELSYNNETSVKDALRRVELGVKGLYDRADAADQSDAEIREELERTHPHPPKESHDR